MANKWDKQMKEITERLEQGVKELFTSERYTEYLRTMAQFHNYSFNNKVLIAAQRPNATLVAGYQAWQKKFNRQVKRGEKGIQIIAPAPVKEYEEREKLDENGEIILKPDGQPETETVEYVIPRFRVATVFDYAQTYGEPLPGIDIDELTASVENYALFMEAIRQVSPVPIRFDEIESDAKGFYSSTNKEIIIQNGMSESQTMKTAIHEVTHAKLHDRDIMAGLGEQKDQTTKEVEAESVAFTVCNALGLDTSDYSFPYIAGWSSGMELKELRSSMDTIRHTAAEFLDEMTEAIHSLQREQPKLFITQFAQDLIAEAETEAGKSLFSEEQKNLIVNYAYKFDSIENTSDIVDDLAQAIKEGDASSIRMIEQDMQEEIDSLPDDQIGFSEMHEAGFRSASVLPLTMERAVELHRQDLPVYSLRNDGSMELMNTEQDILAHNGLFGVDAREWDRHRVLQRAQENREEYQEIEIFEVPALHSDGRIRQEEVPEGMYRYDLRGSDYDPGEPASVENQVFVNHAGTVITLIPLPMPERGYLRLGEGLNFVGGMMTIAEFRSQYAGMDVTAVNEKMTDAVCRENEELLLTPDATNSRYAIYQLDPNGNGDDKRFMNMDYIRSHGGEIIGDEYNLIYSGVLSSQETLDSLYQRFNINHPEGYTGHSLSVSDVILLNRDGQVQSYFVDSFGFSELPDFVRQRQEMMEPKESVQVTEQTSGLSIEGHEGTWHTIDQTELEGEQFFLMEHDEYGDEAACIVVNESGELVAEDLWNGFDDGFHEAVREYFEDKGIIYEPENRKTEETKDTEQPPAAKAYPPLYLRNGAYAREHGELDDFRASLRLNQECKQAIEDAIRENFDGMHLNADTVKPVLEAYGAERMSFVIASTIQHLSWDGRFSSDNKEWATHYPIKGVDIMGERSYELTVSSHPAVLDGFIDLFRQELKEYERENTAEQAVTGRDKIAYELPDGRSLLLEKAKGGYDYTVYRADMSILDVGAYMEAGFPFSDMLEDLADDFHFDVSELREIPYEAFVEKLDIKTQETAAFSEEQHIDAVSQVSDRTEPVISLHGKSMAEIEETVLCYAQEQIDQMGLHDEVQILGARVYGSRSREGLYTDTSDVDVVLSYAGNLREDTFFNILHADGLSVAGIAVDINPISAETNQTLEQYMKSAEQYLDEKAAQAAIPQGKEKMEPAISFYVAECMEFPVLGEYHEGLTLPEAVELYQQIPADRMHGVKGIGFDLQDGSIYDGKHELMTAGVIHTEDINAIPHFHDSSLVQNAVAGLERLLAAREEPVKEEHQTRQEPAAETAKQPELIPKEPAGGKKESVLKALRERQAKLKQEEPAKDKQKTQNKKKGEQEL